MKWKIKIVTNCQINKIMEKETQKELFNILYRLEDIYDYDNTKLGKEIGELVNKLQTELLNK